MKKEIVTIIFAVIIGTPIALLVAFILYNLGLSQFGCGIFTGMFIAYTSPYLRTIVKDRILEFN